jgi:hypothetical protein
VAQFVQPSIQMATPATERTEHDVRRVTTPVTWCWRYREARSPLVSLYEEARRAHWDPGALPWQHAGAVGDRERWLLSQALHAAQARMLAGAELIGTLPAVDAKVYFGSEVADDARQVDVLGRYLRTAGDVEAAHPEMIRAVDLLLAERAWHRTLVVGHQMEQLVAVALRHCRDHADPLLDEATARLLAAHPRHTTFATLVLQPALAAAGEAEQRDLTAFAADIAGALVAALAAGPATAEVAAELDYRLAGAPARLGLS